MIQLGHPVLGELEKRAAIEVIESGWLTMDGRVKDFEQAFANLHRAHDAVAVSSCTAGLHLILAALGIGNGDEVLVPSLTFVATVNAVLYVGAKPILVDIEDLRTPNISIDDAAAKLSVKVKAVIVMHYAGNMADMSKWRKFTDKNNLFLIEDAAHAPGAEHVGRFSDAAAFSFFSNKNMTTGEGGMIVARDENVLERIRYMRSHGMTTGTLERERGHAYSYDVIMLGYNYRLDELRAAIGMVQLERLPQWNKRRFDLTNLYREYLAEFLPDVVVPFDKTNETTAHLMPVLLPDDINRERIMSCLRDVGIQSSIHYPPVHRFSYYSNRFRYISLPKTEQFSARELTLPLHPSLRDRDIKRVVQTLQKTINKI